VYNYRRRQSEYPLKSQTYAEIFESFLVNQINNLRCVLSYSEFGVRMQHMTPDVGPGYPVEHMHGELVPGHVHSHTGQHAVVVGVPSISVNAINRRGIGSEVSDALLVVEGYASHLTATVASSKHRMQVCMGKVTLKPALLCAAPYVMQENL
jgi:hypothetical protein